MEKSPAFQWYPKQALGDDKILAMDWDAKGMHYTLLWISWQQEPPGTLPDDTDAIRRWLGSPSEDIWRRVRPQVMAAWPIQGSRRVNAGMVRAWERQQIYKQNGSKNKAKPEQLAEEENTVTPGITFKLINPEELRLLVDRLFVFYCETFRRNPKQYSLTEKRRKKAELRLLDRLKIHSGDATKVETEARLVISNLAASEWHREKGFIDWIEQVFRSEEEYEKRLNWKSQGADNGKPTETNTTPRPSLTDDHCPTCAGTGWKKIGTRVTECDCRNRAKTKIPAATTTS